MKRVQYYMKHELSVILLLLLGGLFSCAKTEISDSTEPHLFRAIVSQQGNIVNEVRAINTRFVSHDFRYNTGYLTFQATPEIIDLILQERADDLQKQPRHIRLTKYDFEPSWWPKEESLRLLPLWSDLAAVFFWYDATSNVAYVVYRDD